MDNFSITPKVCNERDVSSGVHSRSTSPLQSTHIVVSLNCGRWPVAPFRLIQQTQGNRTLLGKQRGGRGAVIACRV